MNRAASVRQHQRELASGATEYPASRPPGGLLHRLFQPARLAFHRRSHRSMAGRRRRLLPAAGGDAAAAARGAPPRHAPCRRGCRHRQPEGFAPSETTGRSLPRAANPGCAHGGRRSGPAPPRPPTPRWQGGRQAVLPASVTRQALPVVQARSGNPRRRLRRQQQPHSPCATGRASAIAPFASTSTRTTASASCFPQHPTTRPTRTCPASSACS